MSTATFNIKSYNLMLKVVICYLNLQALKLFKILSEIKITDYIQSIIQKTHLV